jgi:hypothetical protein
MMIKYIISLTDHRLLSKYLNIQNSLQLLNIKLCRAFTLIDQGTIYHNSTETLCERDYIAYTPFPHC